MQRTLFSLLLFRSLPIAQADLPSCAWRGADKAPGNLSFTITIPDCNEPGTRITISHWSINGRLTK